MGLFSYKGEAAVNCATYRTKDYMVSGLVESDKGEFTQVLYHPVKDYVAIGSDDTAVGCSLYLPGRFL
jgi:hypothetical protein